MPTATIKTRQVPLFGYVRKNPIDYYELHNRIIPVYRVCKFQKGNIIIPKITQIWRYLELYSTNVCILCTLRKSRHRNARIWVNMVIVMHKLTAILGGY